MAKEKNVCVTAEQRAAWLKLLGADPSDKTLRLFDTALTAGFRPARGSAPVCPSCAFGGSGDCVAQREASGVYTDGCVIAGMYWVHIDPLDAVLEAADKVIECWSGGDLAAAVRDLAAAVAGYKADKGAT